MKNLKVLTTLFVSFLLISQGLLAQEVIKGEIRSLEPEKSIKTETSVKVTDQNENLKLEKKISESTSERKSVTTTPVIKSGSSFEKKEGNTLSETTTKVSPVSKSPLVKKEVTTGPLVVKGNQSSLEKTVTNGVQTTPNKPALEGQSVTPGVSTKAFNNSENAVSGSTTTQVANPIATQKVGSGSNALMNNKAASPAQTTITGQSDTHIIINESNGALFNGEAQLMSTLKQTNVALYNDYLKERKTISAILNRVNANTFKNERERSKYTKQLNSYKLKYNF